VSTKVKIFEDCRWRELVVPALVACTAVGAIIGAVYANILNENSFQTLSQNIGKLLYDSSDSIQNENIAFIEIFIKYSKIPIIIWFLAFAPLSPLITFFLISAKGAGVGFTTAIIVRGYGVKGLLFSFILYFFQNLILFPSYIYTSHMSLKFASKKTKEKRLSEYSLTLTASLACVLLAALVEAYFVPFLFSIFI